MTSGISFGAPIVVFQGSAQQVPYLTAIDPTKPTITFTRQTWESPQFYSSGPSIARTPDGSFTVLWSYTDLTWPPTSQIFFGAPPSPTAGASHTFIEQFDATGTALGSPQEISLQDGGKSPVATIAVDQSNNPVIAYDQRNSAGIITGIDVEVYDPSSKSFGPPIVVFQGSAQQVSFQLQIPGGPTSTSQIWESPQLYSSGPGIARAPDGSFTVLWSYTDETWSQPSLLAPPVATPGASHTFIAKYSATGVKLASQEISLQDGGKSPVATIAVDQSNNPVIAYEQHNAANIITGVDVQVAAASLFTEGSDTVRFDNLDPGQKQAIVDLVAHGNQAALYKALGGNDTVTLPDTTTIPTSKGTVTWDPTKTFDAGAGDDTIQGGKLADEIELGDGNDTIFGSPGNDVITGGAGQDTFDYQSGKYANFKDFASIAAQTLQTLHGDDTNSGSAFETDSAKQDIVKLPGDPSGYKFTVSLGSDWQHTITTVQTGPSIAASTRPTVVLTTDGIERAKFSADVSNIIRNDDGAPLRAADAISDFAAAAVTVYNDNTTLAQAKRWHPIAAMELGIAPSDYGSFSSYTFRNGFYAQKTILGDAAGSVVSGLLDGKRTILVTFKGSDLDSDWITDFARLLPVRSTSLYFDRYAPLVAGLESYLGDSGFNKDQGTGPVFDQIVVTGHSLGGAMTQHLVADIANMGEPLLLPKVEGFTFGSIGAAVSDGASNHMMNFVHTGDIANGLNPVVNGRAGSTVWINTSRAWSVSSQHSIEIYAADTRDLCDFAQNQSSPFGSTTVAECLRGGTVWEGDTTFGNSIEVALGSDKGDVIHAKAADNFVLGGIANDEIQVGSRDLFPTSTRVFDGGGGSNTLELAGNRADFDWQSTSTTFGPAIDLYWKGPLGLTSVGQLYNINQLVFSGYEGRQSVPLSLVSSNVAEVASTTAATEDAGPFVVKLDGTGTKIQVATTGQTTLKVDHSFDYTDAGDGNLTVLGTSLNDIIVLGQGKKSVDAGGGNDIISVKSADATLGVTPSDSIKVKGGAGDDIISFGSGVGTALYGGDRANYSVTTLSDDTVQIKDLRPSSPDGTDTVTNAALFKFADGTVTRASLDNAPLIIAANQPTSHGQQLAASTLFKAIDPDLGDTVAKYQVRDLTADSTSGFFVLNGQPQLANKVVEIPAAQLDTLAFQTGRVTDQIQVRASDGFVWSAWKTLSLVVDTVAPTVKTATPTSANAGAVSGSDVTITLKMSEPVTVTNQPTLKLNDGAIATYVGGSATNTLTFTYHVGSESTADLKVIGIDQSSGTVTDLVGNPFASTASTDLKLAINTDSWKQGVSGNWTDATKWVEAVPDANHEASIAAAGTYTITSPSDVTVAALNIANKTATLSITGGTFTATNGTGADVNTGIIAVQNGATLVLGGTITNNGTIAAAGTLKLEGAVTGSGKTKISGTGEMEIAHANSAENVTFGASATGKLILDASQSYTGTITGFGLTNAHSALIDLTDVTFGANTKVSYASTGSNKGTLTIDDQAGDIAHIKFAGGTYTTANFHIATDNNGGTLVTDPYVVVQKPGNAPATIADDTVLEVNTPDSGKVTFAGTTGTLWLDQASTFTGAVSGFGAHNCIDLSEIAFGPNTTLGYSENSSHTGGTLTVTAGERSASVALLGNYIASSFTTASDGHGGTLVTEASATAENLQPLTLPHA
jgi:hypothetical protein